MNYRREIDGLRAFAVMPVILFHAGFQAFSGGFVGVDVFFVISGYLITSIIIDEKQAGTFSLLGFYERRARRILPALFLVMLVCIPFAWLCLLPSDMKDFSKSLVAVSVFASNILFWRESGYFDKAAELKPLLHTWSLGVEEQYYMLYPLFLIAAWRLGRKWILAFLVVIAVVSLAVAQWGALNHPRLAFFLLPARGWELLIGSFIAFYRSSQTPVLGVVISNNLISQAASLVGLLLIGYAVFVFDKSTPFPSLYALVPTVGAALIVLFAYPHTVVGKLLGSKAFVGVGAISYSAYLWHQPLFAFARNRSLTEPSVSVLIVLSVAALGLAYFSWRYVEQPFRLKGLISRGKIFILSIGASAFFVAVGLLNQSTAISIAPNVAWESLAIKLKSEGDVCERATLSKYDGVEGCHFGALNSRKVVALYGDSHAQAISVELNASFQKENIKGVWVSAKYCEVVPKVFDSSGVNVATIKACEKSFENLIEYIRGNVDSIIVTSRWSFRLYPVRGEIDELTFRNSDGGAEFEKYREYVAVKPDYETGYGVDEKRSALKHFISALLSLNKKLMFVYPVPEIGWNIARLNFHFYRAYGYPLPEISVSYDDFKSRNKFVYSVFDQFNWNENFISVRPEDIFCNTFLQGRCAAQFDAVPFYYDDDHLSDIGARYVVNALMGHVQKTK